MDPGLALEEALVRAEYADTGRLPKRPEIINRCRCSEYNTLTPDNYRIGCKPTDGHD